jgi:uncharacterized protein (TIGR01777 family)
MECGHEVIRLVRHTPGPGEVWWDPDAGRIDTAGLESFDGVVHLATRPWPFRWTGKAKKAIHASRLNTNRLLAGSLAACTSRPRVLICAAGIGCYPSSGDTILTEDSPLGTNFLARLDLDGEAVTDSASAAGIRVVHLRIPQVMGGRALQYVGFQAGDGQQWIPWVGLDEMAFIIEFALKTDSLSGPVNAVSPNPLRNADFATTATRALGQKRGGVMPSFIVRLVMGEMGQEFLLASRRGIPAKLLDSGYSFRFPKLEDALRHEQESMNAERTSRAVEKVPTLRT